MGRLDRLDELEDAVEETAEAETAVEVAWRDAAPSERPEGVTWDADARRLTFDAWGKQRDCLDALATEDADVVAFLAGYGAGKTTLGARWILQVSVDHPGTHVLAMGQSYSKARASTFEKLFQQLPGDRTAIRTSAFNGPESSPLVADYNRTAHRLTLVNGSRITLGSADEYSRFAGSEFGAIWCDEPSHYGDELFDLLEMLGSRLRGVDGPQTQLWTLTGAGYNSAYRILEKREDRNGEPLAHNIELIRASTLDNPYLDEGEIQRFKRQYANTAREAQAIEGGFAAATGLVYSSFDRETHVIDHAEAVDHVGEDGWRCYGYDYGWNDPRVVLEAGKGRNGELVILDEFYESGTHVEDAVRWLQQHRKPPGIIYADHSPSDQDKFKQAGYGAEPAEKDIDAGISAVSKRLQPDETTEEPGLFISERCRNLIRELQSYQQEDVGAAGVEDHAADSLRYLVMGVETTPEPSLGIAGANRGGKLG